ncbi:sensor histidine kinase [Nocardioides sp. SYSU D00038]|uniref:sensor histidine kinase n=1 Tax=Nocardioides sp. SYSU D00038 TaxID=2812554 RepID=UPI0019678D8B|nr:histidine kinase [Nocardioides sp. SYSU D00038]
MRIRVALGCALVAAALLVAVPLAASVDAEAVTAVPEVATGSWWLGLAVVLLQAAALLRRPEAPRAVLVGVASGAPVAAAVGLQEATGVTSVAVLAAAFLAVLSEPPRSVVPALAAAAGLVGAGELWQQLDTGGDAATAVGGAVVQGLGTVGVAALAGVVVRSRRDARSAAEDSARALLREQDALVEVAVARERTAMARELHDIAAHHLSGIAVMTGAIGRQIDTDPEGAKRAVGEVRRHSTEMLRDLRKLVGLLREDAAGSGDGSVREESLAGVARLVEAAARVGGEVTLTVHDRPDGSAPGAGVGPLAQLSAYRTVQEALANAARHATGARCEVVVDGRDPAVVRVSVRNDAPPTPRPPGRPPSGGFGVVGMRERAELTGARLHVGPEPDGGWLVSLELPTTDEPEEGR